MISQSVYHCHTRPFSPNNILKPTIRGRHKYQTIVEVLDSYKHASLLHEEKNLPRQKVFQNLSQISLKKMGTGEFFDKNSVMSFDKLENVADIFDRLTFDQLSKHLLSISFTVNIAITQPHTRNLSEREGSVQLIPSLMQLVL